MSSSDISAPLTGVSLETEKPVLPIEEVRRRLAQVGDWITSFSGNPEAKNFVAIRAIYRESTSEEEGTIRDKFTRIEAQYAQSETNAPRNIACVIGRARMPATQKAYDELGTILAGRRPTHIGSPMVLDVSATTGVPTAV